MSTGDIVSIPGSTEHGVMTQLNKEQKKETQSFSFQPEAMQLIHSWVCLTIGGFISDGEGEHTPASSEQLKLVSLGAARTYVLEERSLKDSGND